MRVRIRRSDRCSDRPDPAAVEDGVEGAAELRIAVMDQEPGPVAATVDVHQQVARLLQHPGAVGVARAGYVLDPAAADADEHEYVQPPQRDRVDRGNAGRAYRSVLVCRVSAAEVPRTRFRPDTRLDRGGH